MVGFIFSSTFLIRCGGNWVVARELPCKEEDHPKDRPFVISALKPGIFCVDF